MYTPGLSGIRPFSIINICFGSMYVPPTPEQSTYNKKFYYGRAKKQKCICIANVVIAGQTVVSFNKDSL
jgi:hypothetical protein